MDKRLMLIVDDNEINMGMLTSVFEDEFTIKTASNGKNALAQLGFYGQKISIVLLDLVMPGMDGFEVLKQMRQDAKLLTIPVIVVSGRDEREAGLEAIRCGAADFVTKPVDPDLITIKVEAAINKAENARLRAENEYISLQSDEQAKYRIVVESTGTVVVVFDRQGNKFIYDPSISKYIAGTYDDRRLWQIFMSDMVADISDVKAMQEMVFNIRFGKFGTSGSMNVKLKTPSGKKQWFHMQVFAQSEATDKMILTFNNINDEVVNNEKLRYQAERDELTGLYNRATFFEKAAQMISAHEPGYYVMTCFDIDNFKVVNDQYGTEKGDWILKFVADTFKSGFVPVGGLVGRITADNFAVLYPASLMGSEVIRDIRHKVTVLDGSINPISFSIGRYLVDDLSLSPVAMYDRASLAEASIKGRYNEHVAQYDDSMREQLIREQAIVNEMTYALESGQFEVWLQPQYNHATKALIGAEALVRWRHPQRGIVPPGEFIPVFERNGFVYELDKFVWRETAAIIRKWIDDGREPIPVSVNISRIDLYHDDLVDFITACVDDFSIPIDMLRLEITESAFAKSKKRVITVVKQLISHGFTVEIDDFGSGYSSLNTLKDVPAHILKLDMRFLENSDDAGRGGNVLESVARMAKWLGMAVIAEGVETIEQADYLKSIGCTYVQGYLYAKPMPVNEYELHAQSAGMEKNLLALQTVKHLDNNAFWNPASMDTLIFNSFVGAAHIVEYSTSHAELLRVSEMFMQVLGSRSMTVEDALKLDWKSYFAEESKDAWIRAVQKSLSEGISVTGDYLLLNVPGCPKKSYMRITLRVIATIGDSHLIYCLNENITVQKELEEKERKANEQLQVIMQNIQGSVTAAVVRDGDIRFLFVNARFYEIVGYTKEQFESEVASFQSPIHPDDRQRLMDEVIRASAEGKPFSSVYRIIRRDGKVRWLKSNIAIMSLPDVEEPVQLSVSSDITEQKELEDKERTNAARLRAIMDNISGGVSMMTIVDGSPKIQFANDQFYSLMGYTKEQFETEVPDPREIVHEEDRDSVFGLAAIIDKPTSLVYRITRRDGSMRWLQNNVTFVNMEGYDEPVQLSVTNDITDDRAAIP